MNFLFYFYDNVIVTSLKMVAVQVKVVLSGPEFFQKIACEVGFPISFRYQKLHGKIAFYWLIFVESLSDYFSTLNSGGDKFGVDNLFLSDLYQ